MEQSSCVQAWFCCASQIFQANLPSPPFTFALNSAMGASAFQPTASRHQSLEGTPRYLIVNTPWHVLQSLYHDGEIEMRVIFEILVVRITSCNMFCTRAVSGTSCTSAHSRVYLLVSRKNILTNFKQKATMFSCQGHWVASEFKRLVSKSFGGERNGCPDQGIGGVVASSSPL